MLVVFHEPGCDECARLLARLLARADALWRDEIAIVARPRPRLPHELWVADRFARVHAVLPIHGRAEDEVVADALDWAHFVQSRCEECGAPLDWR